MKLKWFGHSCFLLTAGNGVRILADPFDDSVGYKVPAVEADIVTTSHAHHDHSYINAVKGSFKHINQPGKFLQDGIEIVGVPTFHDECQGAKRGENIIYKFTVDGINICHCGDLGHILSAGQVEKLGAVDVLLVPVGGYYTIDHAGAAEICRLLQPRLIIPMHFKTEAVAYPIAGVDKFLAIRGQGRVLAKKELELAADGSGPAGVVVLSYK